MEHTATVPLDGEMVAGSAPVISVRGLLAEYTVGKAATGSWFALGSVRSETGAGNRPAWVLVGTGDCAEDAVAGLRIELERAASRLPTS